MPTLRSLGLLASVVVLASCGKAALPNDSQPTPSHAGTTKTSEDWKGQQVTTAEELFVGRFPGVNVYRIDGGVQVVIRGKTSVNSDTQPLYVIDGMTIDPGPGGALMGINPGDIDSIQVLKDIGDTAIYGVRGANGVIVIKTKRAK